MRNWKAGFISLHETWRALEYDLLISDSYVSNWNRPFHLINASSSIELTSFDGHFINTQGKKKRKPHWRALLRDQPTDNTLGIPVAPSTLTMTKFSPMVTLPDEVVTCSL